MRRTQLRRTKEQQQVLPSLVALPCFIWDETGEMRPDSPRYNLPLQVLSLDVRYLTHQSSFLTYELLVMLALSSDRLLRRGVRVAVGPALGHAVHLLRWSVPATRARLGVSTGTSKRGTCDTVTQVRVHHVIHEVIFKASSLRAERLYHLRNRRGKNEHSPRQN